MYQNIVFTIMALGGAYITACWAWCLIYYAKGNDVIFDGTEKRDFTFLLYKYVDNTGLLLLMSLLIASITIIAAPFWPVSIPLFGLYGVARRFHFKNKRVNNTVEILKG